MHIIDNLVNLSLVILILFPLFFKYRKLLKIYQSTQSFKRYYNKLANNIYLLDDIIGLGIIITYYIVKRYYEYNFIWFIIVVLLIFYAMLCLRNYKVKLLTNSKQSYFTLFQTATIILFLFLAIGFIMFFTKGMFYAVLFALSLTILGKYLVTIKFFTIDRLIKFCVTKVLVYQVNHKRVSTIFIISNQSTEYLNVCSWQLGHNEKCYVTSSSHCYFADYLEELLKASTYLTSFTYYHNLLQNFNLLDSINNSIIFNEKNTVFSYNNNRYFLGKDFTYDTRKINSQSYYTEIKLLKNKKINYTSDVFYPNNQDILANVIACLEIAKIKYQLLINNGYFENGNLYCEQDVYYSLLKDKTMLTSVCKTLPSNYKIVLHIENQSSVFNLKELINFLNSIPNEIRTVSYVGKFQSIVIKELNNLKFIDKLYLHTSFIKANIMLNQMEIKKPYYVLKILFKE